jgi:hypothetical protein
MEKIIEDEDKVFEITGEVREEYSAKDLRQQIKNLRGQIINILNAGGERAEILAVREEMEACKEKIKELKKNNKLKIAVPVLETVEEIYAENEIVSEVSVVDSVLLDNDIIIKSDI